MLLENFGNARLEPFLLYVNLDMCKLHNINFYDKDNMIYVNSVKPCTDTGGVFLTNIVNARL